MVHTKGHFDEKCRKAQDRQPWSSIDGWRDLMVIKGTY